MNTTAVVPGELRAGAPKDSGLEVVKSCEERHTMGEVSFEGLARTKKRSD